MDTGVYQIRNLVNERVYVGGTEESFKVRWGHHLGRLRAGKHCNQYFQNAWDKYGEDRFVFEILLYCDPEDCLTFEQIGLDTIDNKYNLCPTAGNRTGYKHTEATKRKISQGNLGKVVSDEARKRMRQSGKVKKFSDIHKKNISKANKGEGNGRSKLTIQQVQKIKRMLYDGLRQIDIADRMNTSLRSVEHISQGTAWHYVTI